MARTAWLDNRIYPRLIDWTAAMRSETTNTVPMFFHQIHVITITIINIWSHGRHRAIWCRLLSKTTSRNIEDSESIGIGILWCCLMNVIVIALVQLLDILAFSNSCCVMVLPRTAQMKEFVCCNNQLITTQRQQIYPQNVYLYHLFNLVLVHCALTTKLYEQLICEHKSNECAIHQTMATR